MLKRSAYVAVAAVLSTNLWHIHVKRRTKNSTEGSSLWIMLFFTPNWLKQGFRLNMQLKRAATNVIGPLECHESPSRFCLPFPSTFSGLLIRWIVEINSNKIKNAPSGVPGYIES